VARDNGALWDALWLTARVAAIAAIVALVLGSLAATAVSRSRFFGREVVSFVVILPLALPGIITGIALRSAINIADLPFSTWTVVAGHATFCVVVVYNNVLARLRRTSGSVVEASMDLGASGFQTFRHVLLPSVSTALLAGGMLAFALSVDEIIVTTFTAGNQQTLPIWIFASLNRTQNRPVTHIAAMIVVVLTIVPIVIAQRLAGGAVGISASDPE
jgi:putative spermidine/putrescine transport system permease protein